MVTKVSERQYTEKTRPWLYTKSQICLQTKHFIPSYGQPPDTGTGKKFDDYRRGGEPTAAGAGDPRCEDEPDNRAQAGGIADVYMSTPDARLAHDLLFYLSA